MDGVCLKYLNPSLYFYETFKTKSHFISSKYVPKFRDYENTNYENAGEFVLRCNNMGKLF